MEYVMSAELRLLLTTNKGTTINKRFKNYAELFDYGTVALSDLSGGPEMYAHTEGQWENRGEHYKDFSHGNEECVEIGAAEYHRLLNIEKAARELMEDEEAYFDGVSDSPGDLRRALGMEPY